MNYFRTLLLFDEKEYKVFYLDDSLFLWAIYDIDKIKIFDSTQLIIEECLDNTYFYYKEGSENMYFIKKSLQKTEVIIFNLFIKKIDKYSFLIDIDEVLDVVMDVSSQNMIILSTNGIYVFDIEKHALDKRKLSSVILNENYLTIDLLSDLRITYQEEFPDGYELNINGQRINCHFMKNSKENLFFIWNDIGKFVFNMMTLSMEITFTYCDRGYVVDFLYANEYIVISYIKESISHVILINTKSLKIVKILNSPFRINIENIINGKVYLSETSFESIKIIEFRIDDEVVTKWNPFCFKESKMAISCVNLTKESYNVTVLGSNISRTNSPIVVSFHGGPSSVEVLDNRYGTLFQELIDKGCEIVIFNYPGSVSFSDKYEVKPYHNWQKSINDSFNDLVRDFNYQNRDLLFLGASFGGTVALMLEYEKVKGKIAINPLIDLESHISKLDYKYKNWFNHKFSSLDKENISDSKLFKINKNVIVDYVLSTNDEIIDNSNFFKWNTNKHHKVHVVKGAHSLEKMTIMNIILSIFEKYINSINN